MPAGKYSAISYTEVRSLVIVIFETEESTEYLRWRGLEVFLFFFLASPIDLPEKSKFLLLPEVSLALRFGGLISYEIFSIEKARLTSRRSTSDSML